MTPEKTKGQKTMTGYVNMLDRLTKGRELPEGTTHWAIRSVHPDLSSSHGYRWPFPGNWAEAPGPIVERNNGPCPADVGDGLCVANNWAGMASGGIPAITLLLCAFHGDDALSLVSGSTIRVRKAFVVDLLDGQKLDYSGAALSEADLRGANLLRAALTGADLSEADLSGAYLTGANLAGANLAWANLYRATLRRADLNGADLTGADLTGADLTGADLTRADLTGADLTGADLTRADLTGAIGAVR